MKTNLIAACLLPALLGTSAFAVGFIGTPTPELGQGKWGLGFNYSYSSQDFDKKTYTWDDGTTEKLKLKNFNTGRYYGSIGYGICDSMDIYAQLGFADVKTGAYESWDGGNFDWGMNFDNDFAWGWGTKYLLADQGNIDWGAVFQMNWLDTQFEGVVDSAQDEVDIDIWDLMVAIGPVIDLGCCKLYGGPYYYYLHGDYDEVWDGDHVSTDLRNNDFGGYIGTAFDLSSSCSLKMEYATNLNKSWDLSTGILFKF